MSTPQVMLGLLAPGPRHGYELKHEYDTKFPRAKPLAYGQVYATLSRLARDGLIDIADVGVVQGPERTVYQLTEQGQRRLSAWLDEVEPPMPFVSSVLMTKVVVALLVRGEVRTYLIAQRAAHLARMRELTASKTGPGVGVLDIVAADYALTHLEADLRWMDTTVQRLDELAREINR